MACSAHSFAAPGETTLVSVRDPSIALLTPSGESEDVAISGEGRFVAFASDAPNVIANDTNERTDVFVLDRVTGLIERVSIDSSGNESNSDSSRPTLSADGRYVAFSSNASNLVSGDTNQGYDVFVHDRRTHATTRVSVSSTGEQASVSDPESQPGSGSGFISPDGRYVAFLSNAENFAPGALPGISQAYLHDRVTHTTVPVSVNAAGQLANDWTAEPVMSADSRFIAFASGASNLVPGDTNDNADIFVRDVRLGTTTRVSVKSNGEQVTGSDGWAFSYSPSISDDGQTIVFESYADDLVPGDTNGSIDVFAHDLRTGLTSRESVAPNGEQANGVSLDGSISPDGLKVLFSSSATNLIPNDTNNSLGDAFLRDRRTGAIQVISVARDGEQGNGNSEGGVISRDGQYAAFLSRATNLARGDSNDHTDVFLRSLPQQRTQLVSKAHTPSSTPPGYSYNSHEHAISADGQFVVFTSDASTLVRNDVYLGRDIFVRNLRARSTALASRNSQGEQSNGHSYEAGISSNGRYVVFNSYASNLFPGDTDSSDDVYVNDRITGVTDHVSPGSNSTITANGQFVVWQDNLMVYLSDWRRNTRELVSRPDTYSIDSSASADGRFVAYEVSGTQTLEVLDRQTGRRSVVTVGYDGSPPNGYTSSPSISGDGRFVAFMSNATNLVNDGVNDDKTHVYVRDRLLGKTVRASQSTGGAPANNVSYEPVMSGNGRYVAFYTEASNLVPNDTNNVYDVFVHDLLTGTTTIESVSSQEELGNLESAFPSLSWDGRKVSFYSNATNFTPNDFNAGTDMFVRERLLPQ
jgi:hypothetical protein